MANNEELILNVETNSPYVIGAVAKVEQLPNGALITITDKNGTTTATVLNGVDGTGIASATLNEDYTLTLLFTDGTSMTTTSIRGATGDSGVYIGEDEPINPEVNVWVDPTGDPYPMEDEIAEQVDDWITAHPEYVTTVQDGAITVPKFAAGVVDTGLNKVGYPAESKATGDAIAADRSRLTAVEGEADALDARITSLATLTEGSTTGDAELIDARTVGSTTYASLHQAIDTEFTNVKSELTQVRNDVAETVSNLSNLNQYLYAKDKYINSSMVETTLAGYDLFKIPIDNLDVIHITWDTVAKFWNAISSSYLLRFELSDNTYRAFTVNDAVVNEDDKEIVVIAPSDSINFCVCAYADYVQYVTVGVNSSEPNIKGDSIDKKQTVIQLSPSNTIKSRNYLHNDNKFGTWALTYYSYFLPVKAGDRFVWSEILSAISRHGVFRKADGTCVEIPKTSTEYTFTVDAMACIYFNSESTTITYYPADSIKIEGKNIVNDSSRDAQYQGFNGVAFGTSLTYRAQTTGGFLNYLPSLSGITFDNQGVGSATILAHAGNPNMLTTITSYSGWSGKRVCLLEGFVNDWYYCGADLGTWKDTGTTTVCGCVRTALTHILTQNPNLTVFLILDHFGNGITASNAVNSVGDTQLEFYQEIEKVALSMGVRVIREYELSEISQLTSQFLLDNIHLNALGSQQSANAIWGGIKATYPNVIGS